MQRRSAQLLHERRKPLNRPPLKKLLSKSRMIKLPFSNWLPKLQLKKLRQQKRQQTSKLSNELHNRL
jgi:hypothetical protein